MVASWNISSLAPQQHFINKLLATHSLDILSSYSYQTLLSSHPTTDPPTTNSVTLFMTWSHLSNSTLHIKPSYGVATSTQT
ncbi:hypothetical protein RI367_008770 [Sorochytrium milnesiophthora]